MRARVVRKERHMSRRELSLAIEIFLRIAVLVLVEDMGFGVRGSGGKESRVQKFVRCFEHKADYMGDTFGEEMLDGLNARLQMHGVFMEDSSKGKTTK